MLTIKKTITQVLIFICITFPGVLTPSLIAQQNPVILDLNSEWQILPEQSEFLFKIKNMWLFNVKGSMDVIDGTVNFNKMNTDDFVSLTIDPSTINTGNNKRDDHLKSEDFFYISEYPTIEFSGGEVVASDIKNSDYMVKGTLTIRGVSHEKNIPISEIAYVNGSKDKIKIIGRVTVDRQKFEIDYSGMIIADEAKVTYTIIAEK